MSADFVSSPLHHEDTEDTKGTKVNRAHRVLRDLRAFVNRGRWKASLVSTLFLVSQASAFAQAPSLSRYSMAQFNICFLRM